ncbi:MAG: hypothetical protein JW818_03385 [Pirellulales bacterium]|nr:hypothetical protein [Pirellulales bacterium]
MRIMTLSSLCWAACASALLSLSPGARTDAAVYAHPPCQQCEQGGYLCYPNTQYWGYFPRQWKMWPGDENRPDIVDPKGIGRELLPTPQGTKPIPLPKEQYADPNVMLEPGLPPVDQGPATGPVPPPQVPFQLEPGIDPGLPAIPDQPTDLKDKDPLSLPIEGTQSKAKTPSKFGPIYGQPSEWGPTSQKPTARQSLAMPATDPAVIRSGAKGGKLFEQMAVRQPTIPQPSGLKRTDSGGPSAPLPSSTSLPKAASRVQEADWKTPIETKKTLIKKPTVEQTPATPSSSSQEWRSQRKTEPAHAERQVEYREPIAKAPLGLEGYCPVELVQSERWLEGDRRLSVEYQGRTYLISGPVQHRLFRAHPERYAPVLAGCDPVLAAEGKGRVPGRTDACAVFEGRLYMFSGQATLAQFRANPKQYVPDTATSQP